LGALRAADHAQPNVIVLGGISYAKSTLIKTYIYRQYIIGRQAG
jgi:hypothetical protein